MVSVVSATVGVWTPGADSFRERCDSEPVPLVVTRIGTRKGQSTHTMTSIEFDSGWIWIEGDGSGSGSVEGDGSGSVDVVEGHRWYFMEWPGVLVCIFLMCVYVCVCVCLYDCVMPEGTYKTYPQVDFSFGSVRPHGWRRLHQGKFP